ncbi:MAG: folylpolyglutamate synthase/dihydrofolate synthase family protein [Bacillota bacterium]|nr:folylpolyglutamate synthase/dihydrofolate synthase family protein [Bacillota bacterium]
MSPEEALAFLHGLYRPGAKPPTSLARVRELLRRLGHPELGLRTVHITGTNGKGSVAATVAEIMRAAGHRTGLFISPYLERFGERVVFDGRELPDEALVSFVPRIRAAVAGMTAAGWDAPAEFEAVTALAALYYQREAADVVSLEAGLGGRLDATNAIPGSLVSVITRVGLDHVDRLGPTVADIAREKADIIRPGGPVVAGRLRPEPLAVITGAAAARRAQLVLLGRDFDYTLHSSGLDGLRLTVRGRLASYDGLHFPLLGEHQADNLACAVAAVECAAERGLPVTPEAIRAGAAAVRWPARLEILSSTPTVILDGAHNPDAIEALAASLRALFGRQGRRLVAVVGALGDKATEAMFASLLPLVDELVVTTPSFAARAMPAERLAALVRDQYPELPVRSVPDIRDAVCAGLSLVGPRDLLLVTGSFYLVGDARRHLRELLGFVSP